MITLASFWESNLGWLIPVILVVFFGLIVLAVILIRKYAKPFKSEDKPKSQEEIAQEELDRVLQPVDDEEAAKQMENFDQQNAIKEEKATKESAPKGEDKPIGK
jgi:flagellar biosynthesis/type III secretory pathway M-ring protein FliF/YscJ